MTFMMYVRPSIVRLSVCLPVCTYQRGFHWTDFLEFWYWGLLGKSVTKNQIWLKLAKHIRHFTPRPK